MIQDYQQDSLFFHLQYVNTNLLHNKLLCNEILKLFFILFQDIKVHKYYYWFAFPAAIYPTIQIPSNSKPKKLNEVSIIENKLFDLYSSIENDENKSFFIVKINDNGDENLIFKSLKDEISLEDKKKNFQNENFDNIYFCFTDPSEYEQPGWILRLYLAFLYETWYDIS